MCLFITRIPKIRVQICCLRLYLCIENCFCRRLLRIVRVTWSETWKTGPNFFFSSFNSALAKVINKLLWLVLPGKICFMPSKLYRSIRELKQRRQRRQRGRQKSNRVRLAKEKLCTCITLFYTFLCCRCMTTMWNCLIFKFCGGLQHKTMTLFFFFWTLIQSFRIQLKKNSPTSDE